MKARYLSVAIVLLLINYLVFATILTRLMSYQPEDVSTPQLDPLPTFTPAPAQPQVVIPTPTPHTPVPTPTNTRVVDQSQNVPPPTPPPPTIEAELISSTTVNIRSGPGTQHNVVGQLNANSTMPIVGRNADASWWQIKTDDGTLGWVAANIVQASQTDKVPVVQ